MNAQYPYTPKILLVDPNRMAQLIAKFYLVSLGCHVDLMSNGWKALHHYEQKSYDLVLASNTLPDLDSVAFISMIRTRSDSRSDTPVVAFIEDPADRFALEEAGYNQAIRKPLTEEVCRYLLSEYLQQTDGNLAAI